MMNTLELFLKWMVFSMCVCHKLMTVLAQEHNITSTNTASDVCVKHFDRGILKCMEPFLMASTSYTTSKLQELNSEKILLKHLCFEYEKMLQCLHSSLANCATLENIRKVQQKLGTNWVKSVNRLCIIQSDISKMSPNHTTDNVADRNKKDQYNPGDTDTNTLENAVSNQLPQHNRKISLWKSKKNQRKLMRERLRYMYNTAELEAYNVMEYYRQRAGILTVTDKPTSFSYRITTNVFILLICLLIAHIIS